MQWVFCRNNRKPQRIRIASCAALGLYLLTLVAVPMLHTHGGEHDVKICCREHPVPPPCHIPAPNSDDSCPVCEFANLVIPFTTVFEPLMERIDIVDEVCIAASIPTVAYAAALPSCRAPPIG